MSTGGLRGWQVAYLQEDVMQGAQKGIRVWRLGELLGQRIRRHVQLQKKARINA